MHRGLPAVIWIFRSPFCFCFRERLPFLDHACQQTLNLKLVLTTCAEIYIRNVLKPNRIPSSVMFKVWTPIFQCSVPPWHSIYVLCSFKCFIYIRYRLWRPVMRWNICFYETTTGIPCWNDFVFCRAARARTWGKGENRVSSVQDLTIRISA